MPRISAPRPSVISNLEKIAEHGKRADGIVKAMLEHSRGSSGERRMVDLNALIDEALNLAYHGARAQDQSFNITLERDFEDGIAPIELAPQDMTRVFLNLFSNGFYAATRRARKDAGAAFMPTLNVTTRDVEDTVEVRVRDNAIGISPDIKDKLFQPFFTTKPNPISSARLGPSGSSAAAYRQPAAPMPASTAVSARPACRSALLSPACPRDARNRADAR